MVGPGVSPTLGHEFELPDLPAQEALGPERIGVLPQIAVVVLPVEVQQHHRVLRDPLAVPLDLTR